MTLNKTFLSKDYTIFAVITTLISAVAILVFTYVFYQLSNSNNDILIEKEAKNIDITISESFDYTNSINTHLGQQIADHGADDLNFILDLFRETNKIANKNTDIISWTSFDWVNADNYQTVNSKLGIRKNPPDMSLRDYSTKSRRKPWFLQVSDPAFGNPSNQWIIPAGTGVIDKSGKYLGTITVGFNIVEFALKIEQRIDKNVDFIVLDNCLNIILQSKAHKINKNNISPKGKSVLELFSNKSGKLKKNIEIENVEYSYYQKAEKYPYVILVGFNKTYLNKEFSALILPRIIEFIALNLFFLLILYLFKTRFLHYLLTNNKLENSLLQTKKFLGVTSHDLKNYIFGISGLAKIILDKKDDYEKNKERNLEFIQTIANQSTELFHFVEDLLDSRQNENGQFALGKMENTDISSLINQIALINKKLALDNKVTIKVKIEDNLPKFNCDSRRLKQIFNNLLTNSIKYSPQNTRVLIKARYLKERGKILIEFADQGIGMSPEEIKIALNGQGKSITNKLQLNKKIDSHGIGMPIVKKLVNLHNGKLIIKSEKGKGTRIKLYFKI